MAEYSTTGTTPTALEVMRAVNGRSISSGTIGAAELAFAEWLQATDLEQEALYVAYRDYYDGNHTNQLTDRMRVFLELVPGVNFNYNFIPLAIDIIQERMALMRFDVQGEDSDTPDNERQGGDNGRLMQWWQYNRLDAGQDEVHHDTLVDGDAFVMVDWDDEKQVPIISGHPAYTSTASDGTGAGIYVAYDEDNQRKVKFAVKVWRIYSGVNKGSQRLNVYTDDAIYKYMTGKGGYQPLVEEGQPWPLPWLDPKTRKPLGVTVIPFEIRRSLVHDLIPFQDAINKAAIDEVAGADVEAFSMITLSGGEEPVDEDGNSTVKIGPRRVLFAPDGTWGSIQAGDIAALSALVDKAIQRLAQRDRVPLQYFQVTGQVSSANSQAANDSGMVSLIDGIARRMGNSWEDVMDAARRVYNAFSNEVLDEGQITAVWNTFERIDQQAALKTKAETAQVMASTFDALVMNNVPRELAALQAGYPPDVAAQMAMTERGNLNGEITQSGMDNEDEASANALPIETGLNGAQINAALTVLEGVVVGTTVPMVAIELLASIGIDRTKATEMVNNTIKKAAPPPELDPNNLDGQITQ